jgi:hypothetical protein
MRSKEIHLHHQELIGEIGRAAGGLRQGGIRVHDHAVVHSDDLFLFARQLARL